MNEFVCEVESLVERGFIGIDENGAERVFVKHGADRTALKRSKGKLYILPHRIRETTFLPPFKPSENKCY